MFIFMCVVSDPTKQCWCSWFHLLNCSQMQFHWVVEPPAQSEFLLSKLQFIPGDVADWSLQYFCTKCRLKTTRKRLLGLQLVLFLVLLLRFILYRGTHVHKQKRTVLSSVKVKNVKYLSARVLSTLSCFCPFEAKDILG